jgi:hypothetical protein
MKIDMSEVAHLPLHDGQGRVTGADGRGYVSTKNRLKREIVDDLIAKGSPLVVYVYGWEIYDWHDGEDARTMWAQIRTHGIHYRNEKNGLTPSAALWSADDGTEVVYLEASC